MFETELSDLKILPKKTTQGGTLEARTRVKMQKIESLPGAHSVRWQARP